jgi:hypothetical protein
VNNMVYVGKANNGLGNLAVRIQISEPGRGIYTSKSGKPFFIESGGFYLVDNPSYHYYWVESAPMTFHPNAVSVKVAGPQSLSGSISRLQVDGQTQISTAFLGGGAALKETDGVERIAKSYQVLVCDPKPVNPCSKLIF